MYIMKYFFLNVPLMMLVAPQPLAPVIAMLICWHTSSATWYLLLVHIPSFFSSFQLMLLAKVIFSKIAWKSREEEVRKSQLSNGHKGLEGMLVVPMEAMAVDELEEAVQQQEEVVDVKELDPDEVVLDV
eukprot:TRINITY_DN88025_c0_g1_i1.p1 TRINITY_DN88025_c0_g1~~TRINITY_DN88025_c0_g1_i1.p1  ORF type:complete len:129 (+),score=40.08 TRINITY_DN88025_c0_g1_i1:2-388(+)